MENKPFVEGEKPDGNFKHLVIRDELATQLLLGNTIKF